MPSSTAAPINDDTTSGWIIITADKTSSPRIAQISGAPNSQPMTTADIAATAINDLAKV